MYNLKGIGVFSGVSQTFKFAGLTELKEKQFDLIYVALQAGGKIIAGIEMLVV